MKNPLLAILRTGRLTAANVLPDLPDTAIGLPTVTDVPCSECAACAVVCPTEAIQLSHDADGAVVSLDRGQCIGCNLCVEACPTGTIAEDRSTCVAVRVRSQLVKSNRPQSVEDVPMGRNPFARSIHIREVSTGDSASDQEVNASLNAVFDVARFGVHFVASPRHADALLVTGPVGRAMQEPLRRCYDAMADPRLVIAVGTAAISGGIYRGTYAEANGVPGILRVDSYVPGDTPHPWSVIHGILLAMGRTP